MADAMLSRYRAEATGTLQVLEAKAEGYRRLVAACAENPQIAPTLLLIEQMPKLVAEQVKAIQNLKIDKITVWDSGANGSSSTAVSAQSTAWPRPSKPGLPRVWSGPGRWP